MNETFEYFNFHNAEIEIKKISSKNNILEPIIFLHEGLGSISLWKDWPLRVSTFLKRDVYIYSRIGMGNSTSIKGPRNIDYMHVEAIEILPKLIKFLKINKSPILLGHSDGASIALIYAGSSVNNYSKCLILEAPHVFVEDQSIKGAKKAKIQWKSKGLREKLKKHHKDVDGAFNGWCNAWTSEAFKSWNIENYLSQINVPIMLIQGKGDEYGTMKQLDIIENTINSKSYRLELEDCGHSPHTQYPELLISKIKKFLDTI